MEELPNFSIPIVVFGNKVKGVNVSCVYANLETALIELALMYLE